MSLHTREQYYVAVKVLLRKEGQLLLIKDKYNDGWDLPGGRIRKDQSSDSLEEILDKKVKEEIGSEIVYKLGEIKTTFRHKRVEEAEIGKPEINIFALGFEAFYESGDIKLGDYIKDYKWVDIDNFKPSDYLYGGWCKGIEEYLV